MTQQKKYYTSLFKSLLGLFFIFFISCQSDKKPKDFVYDRISFNIPQNWKISEVDSVDEDYCSIYIDPKDEDGTSFIFIEWGSGLYDLKNQIKHVQNGYLENPDLQKAGIEFSQIKEDEFSKQKAIFSDFKFSITGIEQEGRLYCFQVPGCEKTVSLVIQYAVVDKDSIVAALKNLEKSFSCQKILA